MNVCGYSRSNHRWMKGVLGCRAVYNYPDPLRCRCGVFQRSRLILAEVLTPRWAPPWRSEVGAGSLRRVCRNGLRRGSSADWIGSSSPVANQHVLLRDFCTGKINIRVKNQTKTAVIVHPRNAPQPSSSCSPDATEAPRRRSRHPSPTWSYSPSRWSLSAPALWNASH